MKLSDRLANRVGVVAGLFFVFFSAVGVAREIENFNRSPSSVIGALLVIFLLNTMLGVILCVLAMKRLRS